MDWTQPPCLLSGSSHPALARALAEALHAPCHYVVPTVFPDGEMQVNLERSVRGEHVFLLQSTAPPVERNLMELLLTADGCRRAGARELTAIIPYFGYARQDRRVHGREAVGARLIADLLAAAHVQRVVAIDAHSTALEGFFSIPFEHVTAYPLLLGAVGDWPRERGVVVAPDLGAVKLANRFGAALDVPVAVVQKVRTSGSSVTTRGISGEVRGRAPLIVDDMISTGATIAAASRALLEAGCEPAITIAATHGLFVGGASELLKALPIERVILTDSVAHGDEVPLRVERVSLATLLAQAVSALALSQSLLPLILRE